MKDRNRDWMLKEHGMDYPFWIDDVYLSFQVYVPEHLRITVTKL